MQSRSFLGLVLVLVLAAASADPPGALLLDATTFESTALAPGKSAFVKFFAPWCGHCKRLKPVWDELADALAEQDDVLVVDVDCTAEGNKELCAKYGVQGYPTVKYFTGSTGAKGEDYKGGRTLEALREFADANFGPSCGPDDTTLCDDAQRILLDAASALPPEELASSIVAMEAEVAAFATAFKDAVTGLQAQYEQFVEDRQKGEKAAGAPLILYRSVAAAAAAKEEGGGGDRDDEDHDEL
jgi:protein disulfide-isomerase-like protein